MIIRLSKLKSITTTDFLVLSAWVYGGLLYFVNIAINLVTGSQLLANLVMATYFVILIMLSFRQWGHKIRLVDVMALFILITIVLVSYLLNEKNQENIAARLPELFFQVIPFYAVGLIIKQEKRTFDILYCGSAAVVLINWLYVAVILGTGREMQEDNLFLAYSVLPHALMMLWYAMEKKRLRNVLLAVAGMIFLMSMGSRGPVVSSLVFIALYLMYSSKGSFKKRFFAVILPTAIVAVIIISGAWEDILLWISDRIKALNLSTRVIDAILYDSAEGSNEARINIYTIMLEHIKQRPFTGYGIYGEWSMIDYTAHQMVLELWCHYGVIVGSILALSGLSTIARAFRKNINSYSQVFILLMCAFGLVRGIYAGSYLSDYIFLLLGFSVAALRLPKTKNTNNEV